MCDTANYLSKYKKTLMNYKYHFYIIYIDNIRSQFGLNTCEEYADSNK